MILTAFFMGLAGSLHCLGMCSPLQMAVTNVSPQAWAKRIIYNAGRIAVYALMGFIVSGLGALLPIGQYQHAFSIVTGTALLAIGLAGGAKLQVTPVASMFAKSQSLLKKAFAKVLQARNNASTFVLGALNGLLPCGISFVALSFCVTLPRAVDGLAFMLAFGLGTLPVMIGLSTLLQPLVAYFRISFRKVSTGLLLVSGVLLIGRGIITHQHAVHSAGPNTSEIVICR